MVAGDEESFPRGQSVESHNQEPGYMLPKRWRPCPNYNGKSSRKIGGSIVAVAVLSIVCGIIGVLGQLNRTDNINWVEFTGTALWSGGMVGLFRQHWRCY